MTQYQSNGLVTKWKSQNIEDGGSKGSLNPLSENSQEKVQSCGMGGIAMNATAAYYEPTSSWPQACGNGSIGASSTEQFGPGSGNQVKGVRYTLNDGIGWIALGVSDYRDEKYNKPASVGPDTSGGKTAIDKWTYDYMGIGFGPKGDGKTTEPVNCWIRRWPAEKKPDGGMTKSVGYIYINCQISPGGDASNPSANISNVSPNKGTCDPKTSKCRDATLGEQAYYAYHGNYWGGMRVEYQVGDTLEFLLTDDEHIQIKINDKVYYTTGVKATSPMFAVAAYTPTCNGTDAAVSGGPPKSALVDKKGKALAGNVLKAAEKLSWTQCNTGDKVAGVSKVEWLVKSETRSSGNKLSGGAIAGIVVGSICGVAIIVGLIIFLTKKKRKPTLAFSKKKK